MRVITDEIAPGASVPAEAVDANVVPSDDSWCCPVLVGDVSVSASSDRVMLFAVWVEEKFLTRNVRVAVVPRGTLPQSKYAGPTC